MNDLAFVGVAVISGLFSLAAISLLQHNWYKKEKAKHNYYIKRAKLTYRHKSNPPAPPQPSGAQDWLQTIQKLPPDVLHGLVDRLGGDESTGEGGIEETLLELVKENPDLVNQFLGKIREKPADQEQHFES